MWPIWVFYLMLLIAAFLFLLLAWEAIRDVNAKAARWWQQWRTHRDHVQWIARRKQFAREALR